MKYIAFSEHLDYFKAYPHRKGNHFENLFLGQNAIETQTDRRIKILKGIEIGAEELQINLVKEFRKKTDLDFILGSYHLGKYKDEYVDFAWIPYNELNKKEIEEILKEYFESIIRMINHFDIDSVAHLTYPLRYIPKNIIDINDFKNDIEKILSLIINKNLSLEVNSKTKDVNELTCPSISIIKKYYEMGGRNITFGSDSHVTNSIGYNIEKIIEALKDIGFDHYSVYIKRKRKDISF